MIISRRRLLRLSGVALSSAIMAGCATAPRFATGGDSDQVGGGSSGAVKKAGEERVAPSSGRVLLTLEGVASYYADDFHGKLTSNGETFDMRSLTAAHRTFPFGTKVRVTNLENNKSVVVRVNDRGPFKEGRIIDLSRAAAEEIDLIKIGTGRVRLEVLEWGLGN